MAQLRKNLRSYIGITRENNVFVVKDRIDEQKRGRDGRSKLVKCRK